MRRIADFIIEYAFPVVAGIIFLGIAALIVMAVLWVGTQLIEEWSR